MDSSKAVMKSSFHTWPHTIVSHNKALSVCQSIQSFTSAILRSSEVSKACLWARSFSSMSCSTTKGKEASFWCTCSSRVLVTSVLESCQPVTKVPSRYCSGPLQVPTRADLHDDNLTSSPPHPAQKQKRESGGRKSERGAFWHLTESHPPSHCGWSRSGPPGLAQVWRCRPEKKLDSGSADDCEIL